MSHKWWHRCTLISTATDAWDTPHDPTVESARLCQLEADFAYGMNEGRSYARFQHTVTDGGRIWFFVEPAPKGAKSKHAGVGAVGAVCDWASEGTE